MRILTQSTDYTNSTLFQKRVILKDIWEFRKRNNIKFTKAIYKTKPLNPRYPHESHSSKRRGIAKTKMPIGIANALPNSLLIRRIAY